MELLVFSKKKLLYASGASFSTCLSNVRPDSNVFDSSPRAGKKYRLVDNIGARLGSEANFGSHKIKIAS